MRMVELYTNSWRTQGLRSTTASTELAERPEILQYAVLASGSSDYRPQDRAEGDQGCG